jgi:hypothetical protein
MLSEWLGVVYLTPSSASSGGAAVAAIWMGAYLRT